VEPCDRCDRKDECDPRPREAAYVLATARLRGRRHRAERRPRQVPHDHRDGSGNSAERTVSSIDAGNMQNPPSSTVLPQTAESVRATNGVRKLAKSDMTIAANVEERQCRRTSCSSSQYQPLMDDRRRDDRGAMAQRSASSLDRSARHRPLSCSETPLGRVRTLELLTSVCRR
jgi:hypothetical protein